MPCHLNVKFLYNFTAIGRSTDIGEIFSQTVSKLHFLHDNLAPTKRAPCQYNMTLIASVRLRAAGNP